MRKLYVSPEAEVAPVWPQGCLCQSPNGFNGENGTEYLIPGGGGYEEL